MVPNALRSSVDSASADESFSLFFEAEKTLKVRSPGRPFSNAVRSKETLIFSVFGTIKTVAPENTEKTPTTKTMRRVNAVNQNIRLPKKEFCLFVRIGLPSSSFVLFARFLKILESSSLTSVSPLDYLQESGMGICRMLFLSRGTMSLKTFFGIKLNKKAI